MLAIGLSLAAGTAIYARPIVSGRRAALPVPEMEFMGSIAYTDLQPALTDPDCTERLGGRQGLYKPGRATPTPSSRKRRGLLYGGFCWHPNRPWMNAMSRPTSRCFPAMLVMTTSQTQTVSSPVPAIRSGTGDQVGDNAEHVITAGGTDASAVLDGFTITAGHGEVGAGSTMWAVRRHCPI